MVWYLVYPMLLVHFLITRLMPGKYDGHSADVILKLILFIEMLYIDSYANGNCTSELVNTASCTVNVIYRWPGT